MKCGSLCKSSFARSGMKDRRLGDGYKPPPPPLVWHLPSLRSTSIIVCASAQTRNPLLAMSRPLSLHQLQYQSSYSSYSSASGNPAVQPVPQPYPYDIAQPNLTAPAPQPGTQPQTTFPPADLRQDVQREIDMIRGVVRNTRFFIRLHLYLSDNNSCSDWKAPAVTFKLFVINPAAIAVRAFLRH